ncbi:cytochrome P450 [Halobacillus locisalis]|uniref:Cytochrome P450 n=1 Tax=Halobacillus locisalis TaxID=220753 RepID=A0A838CQF2_9BACI|nr:cytochrome P450 [Halobacillus locisalis]MBA2174220.1 cytochrome P450 [Halobacillus locisalis]
MYRLRSRSPIGHLSVFRGDPLAFLQSLTDYNESIVQFRLGRKRIFLLLHPDLTKEVLITKSTHFHKSKPFQELEPLLGSGLLLSEDDLHHKQRNIIQPSFTPRHIKEYSQQMSEGILQYLKKWEDEGVRNVSEDMMELALVMITNTMFSMDVKDGQKRVGDSLEKVMAIATKRIRSIIKTPGSWRTKENLVFQQSVNDLNDVVLEIIKGREIEEEKREDLLGVLMQAVNEKDEKMSREQLKDEVMTILLAGHETTATALAWTLHLLTRHPDIYEKVEAEICKVYDSRMLTYEDVHQLPFTKRVLQESMRLYPPVWLFGRRAVDHVSIGDQYLKPGDTVMISPYVMHRHPDFVESPNAFQPERFEGDLFKQEFYFPFGGGNRVCIGQHFAMLEAMLILASVIQRYRFSVIDKKEIIPNPLITLRMMDSLRLKVVRKS